MLQRVSVTEKPKNTVYPDNLKWVAKKSPTKTKEENKMLRHTASTTVSLQNNTHGISALAEGDIITTLGFYTEGDGGGAEFTVEDIDNKPIEQYFEHAIVGTNFKAVMIVEDGTVNIDQLGAKGDAVLADTFYNTVTTAESCDIRTGETLDANTNSTDNTGVLNYVFEKDSVKKIHLGAGKIYGIKNAVKAKSNKVLDGNGATIMNITDTRFSMIGFNEESLETFTENVEIKNVHLINNYLFTKSGYSRGIFIRNAKNISLQDVVIEKSGVGINVTGDKNDENFNTVSIQNLRMFDVSMGIEWNDVEYSSITDSYISCDYNLLYSSTESNPSDSRKGYHCIYIDGVARNCIFKNLILKNAGYGSAINRSWADSESDEIYTSYSLAFENIIIDNVRTALAIGHNTHDSMFTNVVATNLRGDGINLSGVKNVVVSNCSFSYDPDFGDNCGGIFIPNNKPDSPNYYVNDTLIKNCTFSFKSKIIYTDDNRMLEGDSLTVKNCLFRIDTPSLSYGYNPAFFKGTFSKISFVGCTFEVSGFESENHSKNGVLFYLDSSRKKKMNFSFTDCSFINNGTVSVNSPILSNSVYDNYNVICCQAKNCLLKGFRWTIRIATTNDTNGNSGVNPGFNETGTNSMIEDQAAAALTDKKRFLSLGNIYLCTDENDMSRIVGYKAAKDFGV